MGTIFTAQKENVAPSSSSSTVITQIDTTTAKKEAKKDKKSTSKDSSKPNLKKKMKASAEVRKSKRPKKPSRLIHEETYILENVVKK